MHVAVGTDKDKVGDSCCFESAKFHATGSVTNNTGKIEFFFLRNKAGSLSKKGTEDDPIVCSDVNDDDGDGTSTEAHTQEDQGG